MPNDCERFWLPCLGDVLYTYFRHLWHFLWMRSIINFMLLTLVGVASMTPAGVVDWWRPMYIHYIIWFQYGFPSSITQSVESVIFFGNGWNQHLTLSIVLHIYFDNKSNHFFKLGNKRPKVMSLLLTDVSNSLKRIWNDPKSDSRLPPPSSKRLHTLPMNLNGNYWLNWLVAFDSLIWWIISHI